MTGTLKLYFLLAGIAIVVLAGCSTTKETRRERETVDIRDREWFIPVPAIKETLELKPVPPPETPEEYPNFWDVPILTADEPATPARPAIRANVTHNRSTGQFKLHLYVDSSNVKAKSSDTTRTKVIEIEKEYQPPWYERAWEWVQDKVFWLVIAALLFVVLGAYKRRMG